MYQNQWHLFKAIRVCVFPVKQQINRPGFVNGTTVSHVKHKVDLFAEVEVHPTLTTDLGSECVSTVVCGYLLMTLAHTRRCSESR